VLGHSALEAEAASSEGNTASASAHMALPRSSESAADIGAVALVAAVVVMGGTGGSTMAAERPRSASQRSS